MSDCVFCRIADGDPDGQVIRSYPPASAFGDRARTIVFEPLNPVVPGHLLVVPVIHRANAAEDCTVTAETFGVAAREVARLRGPCNLITSIGREATQTVEHLHVHVVPRAAGDGLHLPWTPR